jgi:hypothetical protein
MRTFFKLLAIVALTLAALGQASTAQATGLRPVSMFKFKGLSANTSFDSFDTSGCILSSLDVFTTEGMVGFSPGKKAPQSSTAIFLSQYDLCTDTLLLAAEGVTDLAEPDLQISPRLDSATLNTTVTMFDTLTGNTFDLSVDLSWVGVGPSSRQHSSFRFGDKDCRVISRFKGTVLVAEVSGTVTDGVTNFTPQSSFYGELISSHSREMSIGCV